MGLVDIFRRNISACGFKEETLQVFVRHLEDAISESAAQSRFVVVKEVSDEGVETYVDKNTIRSFRAEHGDTDRTVLWVGNKEYTVNHPVSYIRELLK